MKRKRDQVVESHFQDSTGLSVFSRALQEPQHWAHRYINIWDPTDRFFMNH
jgi:hypothetical protein